MLTNKLTITDCANQLQVSRVTVYSYIKKGIITPRKTPAGKQYFTQEDIDTASEKLMNGVKEDDRI